MEELSASCAENVTDGWSKVICGPLSAATESSFSYSNVVTKVLRYHLIALVITNLPNAFKV